jgi:two-component system cell cycle sensor histidine kinase/response regulator CckA
MAANGGRVLVVDDEPGILDLVAAMLRSRGYKPIAAESGAAALAHLMERADEIDLLVTDVNMPAMTGPDLVSRVLELRPDLPILFITGYGAADTLLERYAERYPILRKPFTPDQLVTAVRGCLAGDRV